MNVNKRLINLPTTLPASYDDFKKFWPRFIQNLAGVTDVTTDVLGGSGVNYVPVAYAVFNGAAAPTLHAVNAAVSLDGQHAVYGAKSLHVAITAAQAAAGSAVFLPSNVTFTWPFAPAQKWLLSLECRADLNSAPLKIGVITANGTYLGAVETASVSGATTRLHTVLDLTGDASTRFGLAIEYPGDVAANFWFDGFMVEPAIGDSDTPSPFSITAPPNTWADVVDDGKKPTDNADVTAENTAKRIANQGALATKNFVDADTIADLAVTAQKVADSAITTTKLADAAVEAGKLAEQAVTVGKIAPQAVGTDNIEDFALIAKKFKVRKFFLY